MKELEDKKQSLYTELSEIKSVNTNLTEKMEEDELEILRLDSNYDISINDPDVCLE